MMRALTPMLGAAAWAVEATAQTAALPALFDVAATAETGALAVRARPEAGADALGALEPGATGVEVVARDPAGGWGQVNVGEASGWVALDALAPTADVWGAGRLPTGLRCFGTEPFWSMRPDRARLVVATPEGEVALALGAVLGTGVEGDPRRALVAEGEGRRITLVMTPAACTDGMSDRAYGLGATAIVEVGAEPALLAGCCSIAP